MKTRTLLIAFILLTHSALGEQYIRLETPGETIKPPQLTVEYNANVPNTAQEMGYMYYIETSCDDISLQTGQITSYNVQIPYSEIIYPPRSEITWENQVQGKLLVTYIRATGNVPYKGPFKMTFLCNAALRTGYKRVIRQTVRTKPGPIAMQLSAIYPRAYITGNDKVIDVYENAANPRVWEARYPDEIVLGPNGIADLLRVEDSANGCAQAVAEISGTAEHYATVQDDRNTAGPYTLCARNKLHVTTTADTPIGMAKGAINLSIELP
ncbi:hypothetical protein ACVSXV_20695 [Yersinia enterocolitica]